MNNLKMDDVERVLRAREVARSLAPAPKLGKGRPVLIAIDNMLADKKLADELKELDSYA